MCINILPNQDIKTRGCIQTWILFVGVCFANISVGEFYCSYFFFMLIIFEMAGDLKFIATFQSFFFFEGVLHGYYYYLYVLYFQPDRILRLN